METIGVHVDGVSKRYAHRVKGEIYAARDVRLDVQPGEFLTLLGPSGCGKTTTLRMIAGYEKPDSGRIRFGGQDVTDLPANQRNIGFVFQNYALFPHLSVFENVAYGLRVRGRSDDVIGKSVGDVLALVGLAGYEQQFSAQLSGGEQQRVALARAIVIQPRVLLFDEPLSNLDAKLRVQMRQEIRDLQRRLAITTVYVTHDQEEAMAVSDRIAVMHQGSVVQEGTAEDLYHRPASQFVAQFVGRMNLIAGRVTAIAGETLKIAALGTLISARLPPRVSHRAIRFGSSSVPKPSMSSAVKRQGRSCCLRPSCLAHFSGKKSNIQCAAREKCCRSSVTTRGPTGSLPRVQRSSFALPRTR